MYFLSHSSRANFLTISPPGCYPILISIKVGVFLLIKHVRLSNRMNPYTYNITLNADTAKAHGIKDGDIMEIESATGRKVQGPVKLMQGHHPKLVGIAACSGHWAKGMPIARGKGTNYDRLMEIDLDHVDPVSLNIETATRVRVRKAENQEVTP
ncbi:hypothetical protein ES703_124611 [subsurface metagenome]